MRLFSDMQAEKLNETGDKKEGAVSILSSKVWEPIRENCPAPLSALSKKTRHDKG